LRLRFDEDELALLQASERLWGSALAREARPQSLRSALALAKAARKLIGAKAGSMVSLEEPELQLVTDSVRYAAEELRWQAEEGAAAQDRGSAGRREAIAATFPDLAELGSWRGVGLKRAMDTLANRLDGSLNEAKTSL
jgi:hypothetical protein